jgi:hypothetical protein
MVHDFTIFRSKEDACAGKGPQKTRYLPTMRWSAVGKCDSGETVYYVGIADPPINPQQIIQIGYTLNARPEPDS